MIFASVGMVAAVVLLAGIGLKSWLTKRQALRDTIDRRLK